MVKQLSKTDQSALREAARKVGKRTSAEISIVVVPASGNYHRFVLFYGFIFGSAISFGLWLSGMVSDYYLLLAIQAAAILLIDIVPFLQRTCMCLVPRHARHETAAREAMHQYHALHAHIPPATPFVLLYVSLVEHYVHVITNPTVHKKIPGNWESVTGLFAETIRKKGIRAACNSALQYIAEILEPYFPNK